MGMVRSSVRGFTKGLVSDVLGVDNALLEAFDVYLDRAGELRFRGAKTNVAPEVPTTTGIGSTHTIAYAAHPRLGEISVAANVDAYVPENPSIGFAGSAATLLVRRPQDAAWTDLGQFHVNPVGSSGMVLHNPYADRIAFANGVAILCPSFPTASVDVTFKRCNTMWAGAIKPSYSTGTVSGASGSNTITGVATAWLANAEPGMFFQATAASGIQFSRVTKIVSNTVLLIEDPLPAALAGSAYGLTPVVGIGASSAVWNFAPGFPFAGATFAVACQHQSRLFVGGTRGFASTSEVTRGNRIAWTALIGERDPGNPLYIGMQHWNSAAFIDVEPGVGRFITGLSSIAGVLLVLKDVGVFAVTGGFSTDGSDQGAAIQLLSDTIGCQGVQAYDQGEAGVYFADAQGAYVFTSNGLKNLTVQRIESEWRRNMTGIITVSALRDRVIFQGGPNRDQVYVWDARHEVWLRQRIAQSYSKVGRVFDTAGQQVREDALVRIDVVGPTKPCHDWQTDLVPGTVTGTGNDALSTTTPRADITTHPLPASRVKGNRGRPVKVLIEAFIQLFALPTIPEIEPSVTFGERLVNEPGDGTTVTLEKITPADSTNVAKRRIPVSANTAAALVRLRQDDAAADGAFYAVTLESAETGRHSG